jgi:hypothetical protein
MSKLNLTATRRENESYHTTNKETGVKKPRFRYTLTGSAEALAEYKRIKESEGDYYREDEDGKVLFTSMTKMPTMSIELVDGIIIPKTANEDVMALESVYHAETDPAIKSHLALEIAKAKIAIARQGSAPQPVAQPVSQSIEVSEEEANL